MLGTRLSFLLATTTPNPVLLPRAHLLLSLRPGPSRPSVLLICVYASLLSRRTGGDRRPRQGSQQSAREQRWDRLILNLTLHKEAGRETCSPHLDREPWRWPGSLFSEPCVPGKQGQTERHPERPPWPLPWEGPPPTPAGSTLPPPPHRAQVHFHDTVTTGCYLFSER